MKRIKIFLFLFLALISSDSYSRTWSRISIFVCEPHWGALAREIVGDEADIVMATTANQNPLRISPGPELFEKFRKADLVFCSGGGLEDNWLPALFEQSGNVKVYGNKVRNLVAFDYAKKITNPDFDYEQKDPNLYSYIQLDPNNISLIARELTARLKIIDIGRDDFYQKNYEKFQSNWDKKILRWEAKIAGLKNMPVIIGNNSWNHLASWMNLKIIGIINKDNSRIIVNSKQINDLAEKLRANPAETIITSPYEEEKQTTYLLYQKTKIKITILPNTVYQKVTKRVKIGSLDKLFDEIVDIMYKSSQKNSSPASIYSNQSPYEDDSTQDQ